MSSIVGVLINLFVCLEAVGAVCRFVSHQIYWLNEMPYLICLLGLEEDGLKFYRLNVCRREIGLLHLRDQFGLVARKQR